MALEEKGMALGKRGMARRHAKTLSCDLDKNRKQDFSVPCAACVSPAIINAGDKKNEYY